MTNKDQNNQRETIFGENKNKKGITIKERGDGKLGTSDSRL
jgi:hypothetical protein